MRSVADLRQLDTMVFEADSTGHHLELAERLHDIAAQSPHGPGSLRAEVLVAAAEQFRLAGEPDRGLECARKAVTDGGEVRYGVQPHLVAALYGTGEHEEARAVLADLRRNRPTTLDVHLFVAEVCEQNDVDEALRWYTRGLAIADRGRDADTSGDDKRSLHLAMLLLGRSRLRRSLALPADDWDVTAERIAARAAQVLSEPVPSQRVPSRQSCACGSGRNARRCCGRSTSAYGEVAAVTSRHGDDVIIDVIDL